MTTTNNNQPSTAAPRILSLDAETNGLWGQAFAIGAVLIQDGVETDRFVGRCPIQEPTDSWVAENVLPQLGEVPVTYGSYRELLKSFIGFYTEHKAGATVLAHMGVPVEARLFIDAHNMGILGDWDGPFPLVDCSAIPSIGTSVDAYNRDHGLEVQASEGGTHNPLYDARAAALAYAHWLENN